MYWSGDWTASELAEEFKGHENDYDVVVLPKKDRKATVIHGLGWVVSARSANQAAALAFVAHMGSKQAQETEARNGTAIPAFHGT
ncbi:extracellular solute-binding protein, partial [Salmonella enterica subsp. enterica serovar Infantis]